MPGANQHSMHDWLEGFRAWHQGWVDQGLAILALAEALPKSTH
jgi:hypothetical protein